MTSEATKANLDLLKERNLVWLLSSWKAKLPPGVRPAGDRLSMLVALGFRGEGLGIAEKVSARICPRGAGSNRSTEEWAVLWPLGEDGHLGWTCSCAPHPRQLRPPPCDHVAALAHSYYRQRATWGLTVGSLWEP